MKQAGRGVKRGQTSHHTVKENAKNVYADSSRKILKRAGIDIDGAENGARLWGTHPKQVSQPEHSGRDAARKTGNYHAGTHIYGKENDKLIYKILRDTERKGANIKKILFDITKRMENGTWRTHLKDVA